MRWKSRGREREEKGREGQEERKGRGRQMGKGGEVIERCSIFNVFFSYCHDWEAGSKELVTGSQSFSNLANRGFALG